jgi:hypothetical protein
MCYGLSAGSEPGWLAGAVFFFEGAEVGADVGSVVDVWVLDGIDGAPTLLFFGGSFAISFGGTGCSFGVCRGATPADDQYK